jgi:glucokinase
LILIADLGATNARFCITKDGNSYSNKVSYPINSFDGLEKLCNAYLASQDLVGIQKAVIGVAAPITGDIVNFINTNLEFSIQNLRNKLFPDGLIVVNDLALQANALFGIDEKNLSYIGEKN